MGLAEFNVLSYIDEIITLKPETMPVPEVDWSVVPVSMLPAETPVPDEPSTEQWAGPSMHWTNPYQRSDSTDSEPEPVSQQIPAAISVEHHAVQSTSSSSNELYSYMSKKGKVSLLKCDARHINKDSTESKIEHLIECSDFKGKYWVFGMVSSGHFKEDDLEGFAREHIADKEWPFFVGCNGHVPELYLAYRDNARQSLRTIRGMKCYAIEKSSNGPMRIIQTIDSFFAASSHIYTNLEIQRGQEPATAQSGQMTYEQAEATVIDWGTQQFTYFVQNASLALKRKQTLNELQFVCYHCKASLMEVIKLREDAGDMVFTLDSPAATTACPLSYADGATAAAKKLKLIHWDHETKNFKTLTLDRWLTSEEHLLSSLLLLGPGGLGKSKLMHMIAKELCVAYDQKQHIFGKSIDSLGILSYSGAVRASGAVCLTDFEFKAARGSAYGPEALKSLLDVPEGGSIQGTRYRLE